MGNAPRPSLRALRELATGTTRRVVRVSQWKERPTDELSPERSTHDQGITIYSMKALTGVHTKDPFGAFGPGSVPNIGLPLKLLPREPVLCDSPDRLSRAEFRYERSSPALSKLMGGGVQTTV